ncbi:MAG: response regulator [Candidatus Tantalella remota]|nr:response regulator [Candidatus Tantalella remota]
MKKIYIVDDDKDIIEALTIVLESKGYEVSSQTSEESLIENVKSYDADLVILDVIFPENPSAGFEMARELSRNAGTKEIPILMLSAVNEKGEYGFSFSNRDRDEEYLPVSEFVEKPIQPEALLEKVAKLTV